MESKTLILIDGHALAYRQFFALERTHMRTSDDKPTWAVYGFFKALFDLLKKVKPDAIAVSFDHGRENFRTEAYPEYKANRQSMPDSMKQQFGYLVEGVKALDIPIYQMPGYEADDIIGTIAEKAKNFGHKTLILTGDQDSFQLLDKNENILVLIPSKGELIEYNRDKVYEKVGVWPEQIIDYKGLRGDTSDNIPGVKGIGEKTAVKLLNEFGTVENVLQNLDKISSKSLKEKLETDKEMAEKSKFLATIDRNVPIEFDFEHTHLTMPDLEKLVEFLRSMEMNSFLKQLPTLLTPFNEGISPEISPALLSPKRMEEQKKPPGQLALFTLPENNTEPFSNTNIELDAIIIKDEKTLDDLIKKLKDTGVFSIDAETTGLNTFTAKIVGLSFGINSAIKVENNKILKNDLDASKTETFYLPLAHSEGEQLDVNFVFNKLKDILQDENIYKVLQNAKYEINLLKSYDIELNGMVFDTMLASYTKNPTYKHGLKAQALAYLKYRMTEIEELIGKGKNAITMDKVSIEKSADYACADAKSTLELCGYYSNHIDEDQTKLLYDIEFPLIPVLADMERVGVKIDVEYLKAFSNELQSSIKNIEDQIFKQAGECLNINSPKQVGDMLFEKMKLPSKGKTKTKTGYSTSAAVLELLAKDYPIAGLLLEHRHLSKLKSTYIDALPEIIEPKTGRVHTSFNQTVTSTGRLSSSNPNLQNIPIKTEIGNRIRAAFVPEDRENSVIFSADYSQIELRLLAHFSKDENLTAAFCDNRDIHTDTASKVFGVSIKEVTKDMRREAKAVNFGIIYGQTTYGLATSLDIPPGEAKKIIEKYFETYPRIKEYMQSTIKSAYETGYVKTLYGRKRDMRDDLSSRNKSVREFAERAAINAPLQGTAADLIKLSMIRLYNELKKSKFKAKMILQVHDELVLEIPKNELVEVGELVKSCMELDQPLSVPLVVDMASGQSWMEA